MSNQKKAVIKTVKKGKLKGQFIFTLKSGNGKVVANSAPETYHNRQDAIDTLEGNFPDFKVIDETEDSDYVIVD